jgi:hypothetical protein
MSVTMRLAKQVRNYPGAVGVGSEVVPQADPLAGIRDENLTGMAVSPIAGE